MKTLKQSPINNALDRINSIKPLAISQCAAILPKGDSPIFIDTKIGTVPHPLQIKADCHIYRVGLITHFIVLP
jgi:hypothetical protein